jgi:hypothetical protein
MSPAQPPDYSNLPTVPTAPQVRQPWQFVFLWGLFVGTGMAALGAGIIRTTTHSYELAFVSSGMMCLAAALLALAIDRWRAAPAAALADPA